MKIVNKIDFLKLPSGTVYSKWDKDDKEVLQLYIKGDSYSKNVDWNYMDLLDEIDEKDGYDRSWYKYNREEGDEFKQDFSFQRYRSYDTDLMFVVYDDEDVDKLIFHLVNRFKL